MYSFTLLDLTNRANKSVTISDNVEVSLNNSISQLIASEPIIGNSTAIVSRIPIETPRVDVIPSLKKTITDNIGVRPTIDKFGNPSLEKVGDFSEVGKIRLSGEYLQNFVDFPKFGINVIPLTDVNFRFILSIKKTIEDVNPIMYTSKLFYDELIDAYSQNNPYFVANVIKQQAIITISYDDLLKKIEQYRAIELNVAKVGVVVNKNLFVKSNYTVKKGGLPPALTANPTIELEDLVRYIDWIVSKPSMNYDERLLLATEIGEWSLVNPTGVDTQERVTTNPGVVSITTSPPPNEPPPRPSQRQYPPIGRGGFYEGEETTATDSNVYKWTSRDGGRWAFVEDTTNQSGGGGGGS